MGKRIVSRRCVFCREIKPVSELIRTAKVADEVLIDNAGKAQGRGAYVCRDIKCVKGAQRSRGLERTLKCPVNAKIYESILEVCSR